MKRVTAVATMLAEGHEAPTRSLTHAASQRKGVAAHTPRTPEHLTTGRTEQGHVGGVLVKVFQFRYALNHLGTLLEQPPTVQQVRVGFYYLK